MWDFYGQSNTGRRHLNTWNLPSRLERDMRKVMRSRGTVSTSTVHDIVLNGNKRPNQYAHKMLIMI